MKIVRTNNTQNDFVGLIDKLDAELNVRYGIQQSEYDEHNLIEPIDTAITGYIDEKPVACGCFKVIVIVRQLRSKGCMYTRVIGCTKQQVTEKNAKNNH